MDPPIITPKEESHETGVESPVKSSTLVANSKPLSYLLPSSPLLMPVDHGYKSTLIDKHTSLESAQVDSVNSDQCQQPCQNAESSSIPIPTTSNEASIKGTHPLISILPVDINVYRILHLPSVGILKDASKPDFVQRVSNCNKSVRFTDQPDMRVYELDENEKVTPNLQ